ncbi:hypothetical protein BV22DRAFT_1051411 [Leucogyrophana mollusca]|uniref:Uncharacterized protein n=1 Tax=Leucogyrophana mollusca TaxID=85980 RepID=A0ACB8B132_9AGAM|nr:hypothetical protein BV22DRAFT_1051411 [Leucogyrophana mollusca]
MVVKQPEACLHQLLLMVALRKPMRFVCNQYMRSFDLDDTFPVVTVCGTSSRPERPTLWRRNAARDTGTRRLKTAMRRHGCLDALCFGEHFRRWRQLRHLDFYPGSGLAKRKFRSQPFTPRSRSQPGEREFSPGFTWKKSGSGKSLGLRVVQVLRMAGLLARVHEGIRRGKVGADEGGREERVFSGVEHVVRGEKCAIGGISPVREWPTGHGYDN